MSFWSFPFFARDYSDLSAERSSDIGSISPRRDDMLRQRSLAPRTWTDSQAGFVHLKNKPDGSLVLRANLPGVNKDDVRLDLRDGEGESVLVLNIVKEEEHNSSDRYGGTFARTSSFTVVRTIPLGQRVTIEDIKADLEDSNLIVQVKLPISDARRETTCHLDVNDSTKTRSRTTGGYQPIPSAPLGTMSKGSGRGDDSMIR